MMRGFHVVRRRWLICMLSVFAVVISVVALDPSIVMTFLLFLRSIEEVAFAFVLSS
jgi:hypothetical protein